MWDAKVLCYAENVNMQIVIKETITESTVGPFKVCWQLFDTYNTLLYVSVLNSMLFVPTHVLNSNIVLF